MTPERPKTHKPGLFDVDANQPYDLTDVPDLPAVLRRLADLEPERFALSVWHDDPDEAHTPAYLLISGLELTGHNPDRPWLVRPTAAEPWMWVADPELRAAELLPWLLEVVWAADLRWALMKPHPGRVYVELDDPTGRRIAVGRAHTPSHAVALAYLAALEGRAEQHTPTPT